MGNKEPQNSSVGHIGWLLPTDELLRSVGPTKAVVVNANGRVERIVPLRRLGMVVRP